MLTLSGLILGLNAHAYHVGEHARLTDQAVSEINSCFPGLIEAPAAKRLVNANLDEDYNIFRKDIWYSHYYNPLKKLNMRRYDSADRIDSISTDLTRAAVHDAGNLEMMGQLGHLIHHLQDATVPPHVVPVVHAMSDGFETFAFDGDIATHLSCQELSRQATTDFTDLLQATALGTLHNIDLIHLVIPAKTPLISFNNLIVDGTGFWVQGAGGDFGRYGYLGNSFGNTQFSRDRVDYSIPLDFYRGFKQTQLRLAVQASIRALLGQILSAPLAPVSGQSVGHAHQVLGPARNEASAPRTNFVEFESMDETE